MHIHIEAVTIPPTTQEVGIDGEVYTMEFVKNAVVSHQYLVDALERHQKFNLATDPHYPNSGLFWATEMALKLAGGQK